MKAKLKCKTPAKAQVNYRKRQRTQMNRAERRSADKLVQDPFPFKKHDDRPVPRCCDEIT